MILSLTKLIINKNNHLELMLHRTGWECFYNMACVLNADIYFLWPADVQTKKREKDGEMIYLK